LDSATSKLRIPWNVITYRYVYQDFLEHLGISKEMIHRFYKDKVFNTQILSFIPSNYTYTKYAFMSTTLLKNGAMTHRPVEIKMRSPRGNDGAYVEPFSRYLYEKELLLPQTSMLTIDGSHLENNNQKLVIDAIYRH
jgi:C3 family ADP-ribosyltransferase